MITKSMVKEITMVRKKKVPDINDSKIFLFLIYPNHDPIYQNQPKSKDKLYCSQEQ